MEFTEAERRILLDLLDEEHARDRRTNHIGRTTDETLAAQTVMYETLRQKIVKLPLTPG